MWLSLAGSATTPPIEIIQNAKDDARTVSDDGEEEIQNQGFTIDQNASYSQESFSQASHIEKTERIALTKSSRTSTFKLESTADFVPKTQRD